MPREYDAFIISLMVLAVVLYNNIKNGGGSKFRQQLFRALIACNMLLLMLHAALVYLSDKDGVLTAMMAVQALFLFFGMLYWLFWALFCTLRQGRKLKPRGYVMLVLPIFVFSVFLTLSFNECFIFGIADDNSVVYGPYYYMAAIGASFYVLYALFMVWRSKKSMDRREYYTKLLVPLLPISIFLAEHIFAFDSYMVWPSAAVGLLIMQLYGLSEKMSIDHLTGLYNRKYLDDYVEDLLQTGRAGDKRFAALMLDIDGFKKINDTFGHVEGDKAIKAAAGLLKKSVRKGDFVSRYGGDEFLIVLDECSTSTPAHVIKRLQANVKRYNDEQSLPYRLDFSIGYKVFSAARGLTAKAIFAKIDELMYKDKKSKVCDNNRGVGI